MKRNKYILVDLMLLGLTIALMILFNVVLYPVDQSEPSGKTDSVSKKETKGLWLIDIGNDQNKKTTSGTNSLKTDQLFKEALMSKNKGDLDSALASCNRAITIDSTEAKGYYLRAVINTLLDKETEAINDYSKTLKLNPNYFQAYLNRGLLSIKERQPLNAFFDFTNAIKINPLKSSSFLLSHSFKSIF